MLEERRPMASRLATDKIAADRRKSVVRCSKKEGRCTTTSRNSKSEDEYKAFGGRRARKDCKLVLGCNFSLSRMVRTAVWALHSWNRVDCTCRVAHLMDDIRFRVYKGDQHLVSSID